MVTPLPPSGWPPSAGRTGATRRAERRPSAEHQRRAEAEERGEAESITTRNPVKAASVSGRKLCLNPARATGAPVA